MLSRIGRRVSYLAQCLALAPSTYEAERLCRYRYQKRFIEFKINPGDKVLDVGSGYMPFPLATTLCDPFDEYTGEKTVHDTRPFVKCPVEELPFPDKSFDFVYCSHVLEHVNDPIQSCDELIRVGKRGYIETPSYTTDILRCQAAGSLHRWQVQAIGRVLVFMAYDSRHQQGVKSQAFEELLSTRFNSPALRALHDNQDVFNTMFLWENDFDVIVIEQGGMIEIRRT